MEDAPYFELDLLLSVASGLGRSELSASGKRVYIKDDDCLGETGRESERSDRGLRVVVVAGGGGGVRACCKSASSTHTNKQKTKQQQKRACATCSASCAATTATRATPSSSSSSCAPPRRTCCRCWSRTRKTASSATPRVSRSFFVCLEGVRGGEVLMCWRRSAHATNKHTTTSPKPQKTKQKQKLYS